MLALIEELHYESVILEPLVLFPQDQCGQLATVSPNFLSNLQLQMRYSEEMII